MGRIGSIMKVTNNNNKIIVKESSDEMRAFYDFYVDFLGEKGCIETSLDGSTIEIATWCEEPELICMAMISAKNHKKILKP